LVPWVEEPRLSGEKTVSAGAVTDEGFTEVVSVMDGATEEIRPPSGEEIIEESLVMDGTAKKKYRLMEKLMK
jgi:hypothetical protein